MFNVIQTPGPGKNLFSMSKVTTVEKGSNWYIFTLPCEDGQEYTIKYHGDAPSIAASKLQFFLEVHTDGTSTGGSSTTITPMTKTDYKATFIASSNKILFRFSASQTGMSNDIAAQLFDQYVQLEKGSQATPYEPYQLYKFFGNIAVPSRYQPATSADTTKHPQTLEGYARKVFNGTETVSNQGVNSVRIKTLLSDVEAEGGWIVVNNAIFTHFALSAAYDAQTTPNSAGWYLYNNNMDVIAYFAGGDESSFKAWVAQQHANGTPVTILYPLAISDGSVWNFVKDTEDNVFGYLNKVTGEFIKAYGATGTLGVTVYDHFMLKGGNT